MGLDPNTVAEYLDNTLPGERVPDFEKVCLESDVYLAEVAACHQILTMVLGQPAQIDSEMKSRMYEVINQSAPQSPSAELTLAPAADRSGAMTEDLWVRPARRKPEVPDYLRQRVALPKWKSWAAAIVLLLLLAGAITMALGPLDHTHPIARFLGIAQPQENQLAAGAAAPEQPAATAPDQPENGINGNTSQPPDAADQTRTESNPAPPSPNPNGAACWEFNSH